MRTSARLLLAPAVLVVAVALAGCSVGGAGSDAKSDSKSSSSSKSDSSKSDSSKSDSPAADTSGGCPDSIKDALKKVTTDVTYTEVPVAQSGYPGDTSVLAGACVLASSTASGDSTMILVPGDAALATKVDTAIEAAGFSTLSKSDGTALYTKDKESWVVTSTKGSGNPVYSALGGKFAGPVVVAVRTVTK